MPAPPLAIHAAQREASTAHAAPRAMPRCRATRHDAARRRPMPLAADASFMLDYYAAAAVFAFARLRLMFSTRHFTTRCRS